jgi:hypothetical protein
MNLIILIFTFSLQSKPFKPIILNKPCFNCKLLIVIMFNLCTEKSCFILNTVAYYDMATITAVKIAILQGPWGCIHST